LSVGHKGGKNIKMFKRKTNNLRIKKYCMVVAYLFKFFAFLHKETIKFLIAQKYAIFVSLNRTTFERK